MGPRENKVRPRTETGRLKSWCEVFICPLAVGKKSALDTLFFNPCIKQAGSWGLILTAVQGINPLFTWPQDGLFRGRHCPAGLIHNRNSRFGRPLGTAAAGGLKRDTQRHTTQASQRAAQLLLQPGAFWLCDFQ